AVSEPERLEAGARRLAMTLGRSLALALLAEHAQWCLDHDFGARAAAAARRFALSGVDQISDAMPDDTRLLVPRGWPAVRSPAGGLWYRPAPYLRTGSGSARRWPRPRVVARRGRSRRPTRIHRS